MHFATRVLTGKVAGTFTASAIDLLATASAIDLLATGVEHDS